MGSEKTLPNLLAERAAKVGHEVALRQKHLGIWNEITWNDYFSKVEQLSIYLSENLEFSPG